MRPLPLCTLLAAAAGCAPDEPRREPAPVDAPSVEAAGRDGRAWVRTEGADPKLVYGVPRTDDVTVLFRCLEDRGKLSVGVPAPADLAGESVTLGLTSGNRTTDLPARAEATRMGAAAQIRATIPVDDPTLEGLRRNGRLTVAYDKSGESLETLAGPEERETIARFLDDCAPG